MTQQPNARYPMLRSMNAGLCGLFVIFLLIGANTFRVEAQPHTEVKAAVFTPVTLVTSFDTVTVEMLVQMLTSPIDAQRDHAFDQVRDLVAHSPGIDLSSTVPALASIYENDPDEKYRLAAAVTLYFIGDESGMQQVRQHFVQEPSLIVQYISVCTLIDHYGPKAFGSDAEAVTLARNVLARKWEAERLAKRQRLIERQRLRLWPRVTTGPLEIVEPDSLQPDSLQ